MVTIGMNYKVLPGKAEVFERACRQVITAMEGDSGHSRSFVYKNIDDANSFLIVSDWNDEAAFQGFIRSEAFAKVTNWGKEQILAGRPEHRVYHL